MIILETFPVELFVFENTNIDNKNLISYINDLDVPTKNSSIISILEDFRHHEIFTELYSWFRQCLKEVKEHMKYDCDELSISNSWCNVSLANGGMNLQHHRHSLSFFSGVYYLTDGASTVFEDPVIHRTQAQLEVLRFDYNPTIHIPATAGKLCIFPSWMYHYSNMHWGDQNRYVISFNTFPTGKVNFSIASDSKAEITIK